jgi:hypothetical protein
MHSISAEARSSPPPEKVWTLLADTGSWADWAPFDEAELESAGSPEPQGVGAVRRFRHGRRETWESRFRGKFPVPAALVKPALERFVRRTAEGLARAAERSS